MSERQWHYAQNNQACGPVPESQLRHMLQSGALPRQTYVWTAGMAEWAVAEGIEAFRPQPAPSAHAAAQPAPATAVPPLAPSELVLLNGEQFGTKAMLPVHNVELPHTDAKVNGADVARAMLAAAFLACDQAGAIRLAAQPRKAMMGLRTETDLFAEPGPSGGSLWPEGSFEWCIGRMVAAHGRLQVSGIVHAMLLKDTADADRQCIEVAKEVLHQRGLLTKEQSKAALFFTVNKYRLAPAAAPLLQQYSSQPVKQLLDSVRSGRPDLWSALSTEIVAGTNARTTASD